jgi:hypothetical protein
MCFYFKKVIVINVTRYFAINYIIRISFEIEEAASWYFKSGVRKPAPVYIVNPVKWSGY